MCECPLDLFLNLQTSNWIIAGDNLIVEFLSIWFCFSSIHPRAQFFHVRVCGLTHLSEMCWIIPASGGRRPRGGAGYQLENCLHYDRTKTFFKKHFHWKSFVKVRNDENHHLSQGCVLSRISDSRIVPLIVLSLAHFSHLDLLLAWADITDITPESGYLN